MLSEFFHYLQIDEDIYAIFNSLVFDIQFVTREELDKIINNDCDASMLTVLYNAGIFVKDATTDQQAFEQLKSVVIEQSMQINVLYLDITTHCNLCCSYCFINQNPQSNQKPSHMNKEVAKAAIDKFISVTSQFLDIAQVILYGGEPLANWDVLEYSVRYIRQQDRELKITIVTNGTLLSWEKLIFLKNHNVGIGISLDGPKYINDENRFYANGENTSVYDNVISNLRLLNSLNIEYCISSTITPQLIAIKNQMTKWLTNIGAQKVFWNIYHYSKYEDDWEEFYNDMSDFIFSIHEELENNGISDERLRDQLNLFFDNQFKLHNCAAIGLNQINIKPDGSISICQGDQRIDGNCIGNIMDDDLQEVLKSPSIAWWTKIYTVCRDECKHCEALYVCGGGCPLQSKALFDSREALDKASCIYYKHFLIWLIKAYYAAYKEAAL